MILSVSQPVHQSVSQTVHQSPSQSASVSQSVSIKTLLDHTLYSLTGIDLYIDEPIKHSHWFIFWNSIKPSFNRSCIPSFISSFTPIHFFNLIHFWLYSFLHLFCASFSTDRTEGRRRIPSVSPAPWCNTRVSLPLHRGCDNSSLLLAAPETPRETAHAAGGSCLSMPGTPSRTPSRWLCHCTSVLCPHNTPLWKRKL